MDAETRLPEKIGRFSIQRLLGVGGFGEVFLAHDDDLDRPVALKFPRLDRIASQTDLADYIAEARSAARLKHPAIVSVYDVSTEGDHLFMVLEYVEGRDLAEVLRSERLTQIRCVEVMIEIADAVGYAHEHGLVHRDLKPANVLLDCEGHPHVADFGLAVHEKGQRLLRGQVAGTPYYMSPEQVRGETHRLDGRTDIWSLGVVLYEMLTGQRPFSGETSQELFDEIQHREPRPLRQIDRKIPRELERICLKCLSKRMTDRYSTASDVVDELRHWRERSLSAASLPPGPPTGAAVQAAAPGTSQPSGSESKKPPAKVIPKGLRSFDADDADFFLELLPGPVDREGLPESIRFWKTRIEPADPDKAFAVGLLYGPSGCGKSSLVKAGLLPRLAGHVRAVYVEAALQGTEKRLLRGLRGACRDLAEEDRLVDLILSIREGQVLPRGEKVLIILDQFEQWLYAWRADPQTELVRALRHCDGQSVQCLLLVRDGFGMSAMRFMKALEVPVMEGTNYATVDRFDLEHAGKVLAGFGRAFGRLPEDGSCTPEQERFLEQAVEGLAEEGQVVSVRLALFADMFRGKPWTPASLRRVGGAEGTGVGFLEETLGAAATNPTYRVHQKAARRVLDALLPEHGANIRGHVLSRPELLEISGYAKRPQDFDDLARILDSELRLITPSDPHQAGAQDEPPDAPSASDSAARGYQLTHDYLVPSLRKWLARKRQETMRGRASLLLESQAELWSARPERRYLPSFVEWVTTWLLTRRSQWSERERKMMRSATRLHSLRFLLIAVVLAGMLVAGFSVKARVDRQQQEQVNLVSSLVAELLVAEWERVPEILDKLEPHRELWHDQVTQIAKDSSRSLDQRVRAHLALARHDPESAPYLVNRLLGADVDGPEYRVLFQGLSDYRQQVMEAAGRELGTPAPSGPPTEIEERLNRRARASVALMRLGESRIFWPMLKSSEDPGLRTLLIHRIYPYGVDGKKLFERLAVEKDPSIRQAILLALGAYRSDGLAPDDRRQFVQQCRLLYGSDPDPGVHAGVEWLLRRWGHEETLKEVVAQLAASYPGDRATLRRVLAQLAGGARGAWYVTSHGHTMIVLRAGPSPAEGQGGSVPATHDQAAGHAFALSAHEVTIEQYLRFRPEAEYAGDVSPDRQCPMNKVSWYDAAQYCRWLSGEEEIDESEMCYPPVDEIQAEMTLPDDCLRRAGYRLPTEAEWEFACRAGTVTSRFFGESEEMLPEYAWYDVSCQGHLWPVGSLKPNPLGLFDVYGNVFEWCHEPFAESPAGEDGWTPWEAGPRTGADSRKTGLLRGGAYRRPATLAASAKRESFGSKNGTSFVGFRIARTLRE